MNLYFDRFRFSDRRTLLRELMVSLRFHQRLTLQDLPRDLALQAMNEAWKAVQHPGDATHDTAPEPQPVSGLYVKRNA